MTIYQRSPTPRLAPLVVLQIVCHQQQHQQQQVVPRSRGQLLAGHRPRPRLTWSTTRRHRQRRGAGDRDEKVDKLQEQMSGQVHHQRFETRRRTQCVHDEMYNIDLYELCETVRTTVSHLILEAFQRRYNPLWMREMLDALSRT